MPEPSKLPRRLLTFAVLLVLVVVGLALFRVGPAPEVTVAPELPGIGPATGIAVRAAESGRGLSSLRVELAQGDRTWLLAERSYEPRSFWALWGSRTESDEIRVEAGKTLQPELAAGEATVRVLAGRAGTWLRHPDPAVTEVTLPVRLTPPTLTVLSRPNIVTQGGSGVVVYAVGEGTTRDGVSVGEAFFPGYALAHGEGPATPGERFSLYAAPYAVDDPDFGRGEVAAAASVFRLVAEDELGNRTEVPFLDTFRPHPVTTDTIQLSDAFMGRVMPEILAATPGLGDRGSLLANYLAANGELRRENAATLLRLAAESRPTILWRGPFRQLSNSKVMAPFADRRTYVYEGQAVDRQDHLGYDLASHSRAPVEAANRGVVVLAEYFGIYGNTVVLDHGCGLATLYAHLSSIAVGVGEEVETGQILGQTGQTGLAGGDHLHFSVLVHGRFVQPLEWWDERWVRDRITARLGLP